MIKIDSFSFYFNDILCCCRYPPVSLICLNTSHLCLEKKKYYVNAMSMIIIKSCIAYINFVHACNLIFFFRTFQVIAFVHFSLLVNALLGYWLPQAYVFYNILFMISLLWAIHCRESTDAIQTVSLMSA